jgi:hypothetical protein
VTNRAKKKRAKKKSLKKEGEGQSVKPNAGIEPATFRSLQVEV